MTHQDQREVMRQMKEKVKRVGEMPSIRQRFGITFIANGNGLTIILAMSCIELLHSRLNIGPTPWLVVRNYKM